MTTSFPERLTDLSNHNLIKIRVVCFVYVLSILYLIFIILKVAKTLSFVVSNAGRKFDLDLLGK